VAEHIRKSLFRFLNNLKRKKIEKKDVLLILNKILNKNIQKHICGIRFYKNNLIIKVDNNLWGYQLNLLSPQILKSFQEKGIEKIKIKVG